MVLIGESEGMADIRRVVAQVAGCDVSLALSGEPGTGKKLIAAQLHQRGARACGPLVTVSFSSEPAERYDALVFGDRTQPGALVSSSGGTLVLEDPNVLSAMLQSRLAEALDRRAVPRRGGREAFDTRIVMVSRHSLSNLVALGEFDAQLHAALAAIELQVAPLRERGYDVMQLAAHFAALGASQRARSAPRVASSAATALMSYPWPGNVRELEHVIDAAVEEGPDEITAEHLPERVRDSEPKPLAPIPRVMPTLDEVERRYVAEVMSAVNGNKSRASRVLGVDRRTLYRLLRRLQREGDEMPPE